MRIGDLELHAVSDGTFVARPRYFGEHIAPGAHPELFRQDGMTWLPIGCFLIRTGDRVVLVDAGQGPEAQEMPHGMRLTGGRLPSELRLLGIGPAAVTDIVCTHLHGDHVGWLFGQDGDPVFPRATIWFGAADGRHFVSGRGAADMRSHIRAGFTNPAHAAWLRPIDADTTIAPGLTALLTPGHTPGHLCLVVSSGADRALLLGDSITCPVQLEEPAWHSLGDVDPLLANRTRERMWRELEDGHTTGVGAHFRELAFGRVLAGRQRRWLG